MADEPTEMKPADYQATLASDRRRAEWTERFERYARDAAPRTSPFAEALVELLPPPVGACVLDVATGTGLVAVEAARRVGPRGASGRAARYWLLIFFQHGSHSFTRRHSLPGWRT